MSLVQYSDSDSDAELPASPPAAKKPRLNSINQQPSLPPLPSAFHDLYAYSTRVGVKDDPSLHGGRKRAIPHVEGNWPTHLYLECKQRFRPRVVLSCLIANLGQGTPLKTSSVSLQT